MIKPKYKIGEEVYFFDSFAGAIVCSCVKAYHNASYNVKTPGGASICKKYFYGEYELASGITVKEPLLFNDPIALIDHYLRIFGEFRGYNFERIH